MGDILAAVDNVLPHEQTTRINSNLGSRSPRPRRPIHPIYGSPLICPPLCLTRNRAAFCWPWNPCMNPAGTFPNPTTSRGSRAPPTPPTPPPAPPPPRWWWWCRRRRRRDSAAASSAIRRTWDRNVAMPCDCAQPAEGGRNGGARKVGEPRNLAWRINMDLSRILKGSPSDSAGEGILCGNGGGRS